MPMSDSLEKFRQRYKQQDTNKINKEKKRKEIKVCWLKLHI
jgi:hypothetical protein